MSSKEATRALLSFACKFTGQPRDAETGLDNFGARYYNSSLGRFMTPDPAGNLVASPANPQSWNQYAYVMNNPTTWTDPNGLMRYADSELPSGGGGIVTHGFGSGCTADGIDEPCFAVTGSLLSGGGVECPNDDCGIGTKTPFTCLEDNCGNMSIQYVSAHAYTCDGGLPCTGQEYTQYEKGIKLGQANAIADWLNNWALAVGCTQCPAITGNALVDDPAFDQGGHPNFNLTIALAKWGVRPAPGRYGGLSGSVHLELRKIDGATFLVAHHDTANPLSFFPVGLGIHFLSDVFFGTLDGVTGDYLP